MAHSTAPVATLSHRAVLRVFVRDLLQLAKPRIILLLVITCAAGYLIATKGNPALFNLADFIFVNLGLALSAAGANALNMWWDRDIDQLMHRTAQRPLPQGRLSPAFVLGWGIFLGVASTLLLGLSLNWLTAAMCLSGYLFYVCIYTMLLKRNTVQNIVIGGAAGAFPPLVGWAAVQNSVADPIPWVLFGIIFCWTPPHFWALALLTNRDYTAANIPMYPVVHGVVATQRQIVWYVLVLLPLTLATALLPPFGYLTLLGAFGLGVWWLAPCWQLLQAGEPLHKPLAQRCFIRSLYYLGWVFVLLVLDAWV